eukprot:superscaffoldBa00009085_g23847
MTWNLFQKNLRRIVSQLYIRDNCHPVKASLLVWVQLPLWISFSLALRNLSLDQSGEFGSVWESGSVQSRTQISCPNSKLFVTALQSELAAGGALWFPDLTVPDSTWILPVCLGLTNLLIVEVFSLQRVNPSRFQNVMTNCIRGFSVLMIPIAASVPSVQEAQVEEQSDCRFRQVEEAQEVEVEEQSDCRFRQVEEAQEEFTFLGSPWLCTGSPPVWWDLVTTCSFDLLRSTRSSNSELNAPIPRTETCWLPSSPNTTNNRVLQCASLPAEGCPAGSLLDSCGCCSVCAAAEGELCGGRRAAAHRCGAGLECVKTDADKKNKMGICVCKSNYEVCGTDGETYRNGCALKSANLKAERDGKEPINVQNKGRCAT